MAHPPGLPSPTPTMSNPHCDSLLLAGCRQAATCGGTPGESATALGPVGVVRTKSEPDGAMPQIAPNQHASGQQQPDNSHWTGRIGLAVFFLFIAGICALACYACYQGAKAISHAYLLSSRGKQADARVTAYTPKTIRVSGPGKGSSRRVTLHIHAVAFDGHVGSVKLYEEMAVGSKITVLYLPESPEVVTAGKAGEPFVRLLLSQQVAPNVWGVLLTLAWGLVQWILRLVWSLFGSQAPPVLTEAVDHLTDLSMALIHADQSDS